MPSLDQRDRCLQRQLAFVLVGGRSRYLDLFFSVVFPVVFRRIIILGTAGLALSTLLSPSDE